RSRSRPTDTGAQMVMSRSSRDLPAERAPVSRHPRPARRTSGRTPQYMMVLSPTRAAGVSIRGTDDHAPLGDLIEGSERARRHRDVSGVRDGDAGPDPDA